MVIDDIMNQIATVIKDRLKEEHVRADDDADNIRIILDYLDNRDRRIIKKPRNVIISEELNQKIRSRDFSFKSKSTDDVINEFQYICKKICDGENINFNLSTKIFDSREKNKDIMLNAWRIYHIHISKSDALSKSAMKNNRSSVLLFCIVNSDVVMCLDIVEHPSTKKFFCLNLLRIIHNNKWMDKIGFCCDDDPNYVVGSTKPVIEKEEDLTALYIKCKANLGFELDGKRYFSFDGITGTGDTTHNVILYKKFVTQLKSKIRENDVFLKISDVIFSDDCMKFSLVIIRECHTCKFSFQI